MSGRRPRHFTPPDPHPWRRRVLTGVGTAAVHLIVFGALFWPLAHPPPLKRPPPPPPPLELSLVQAPQPKVPAPPAPKMLEPVVPPKVVPPRITISNPITVKQARTDDRSDLLTASQLAGARVAGEGGGGGCNMAGAIQHALRKDPMVRRAVEDAHRIGKAIMLWNGDWVRTGDQEGKGLSAVREAITWEVAFAPAGCRNMRVHGLVLVSLADGRTRFALGRREWRWSDLLGVSARGRLREDD